jgi:ribosomal-protein-serine acetyltransferase
MTPPLTPMPLLESTNYYLRPLTKIDAASLVASVQESTSTVGKWMSWVTPDYSIEHANNFIEACITGFANKTSFEFGIFSFADNQFVGIAGLNQLNTVSIFCNLGYWVRESAQRRGAASAAIALLREYGFKQIGLTRIEILVAVGNEPSLATARKSGAHMECIARNRLLLKGTPRDAYLLSFIPNDFSTASSADFT